MNLLVFRIGQLGDTIIALPAIWALRNHFAGAKLTFLCDWHIGKPYVLGADLLGNSRLLDAFETYPVYADGAGKYFRPLHFASLLLRLRARKFDGLIYLAPSGRNPKCIQRDKMFFRAAGIKQFFAMNGFSESQDENVHAPLPRVEHEADHLLKRLSLSGVPVPIPGQGSMDLNLTREEETNVQKWVQRLPSDGQRVWIGFGPGSKMPAKRWPLELFAQAGKELIQRWDIWPVVFGGMEDQGIGNELLSSWGRGYNAAGELGLRASALALKRCALYVGNDTGTMHLAAAAGTKCIGIFSARDWPGRWDPYGSGHKVLRASIECEGCKLIECVDRKNECLSRISPREVVAACEDSLAGVSHQLARAI
jgi:heptosyltransferase-3